MYGFGEIKGNQQVKEILQRAVATGRFSHAYLFQGAKGMGKKLLANAFAKALQCSESLDGACGVCAGCRAFDSGNHPDVLYVSPTKTKSLGVEDIREQIVKQAEMKQYQYPYKIFIVDEADKMTVAAQNALLKTLEEPPEYVVFLLLAEQLYDFLPTVLSRCTVLKLRPVPQNQVESYLLEQGLCSKETARLFAEYAQGSIGQAVELVSSQEFGAMREHMISLLCQLKEQEIPAVLEQAKQLEPYKKDENFLEIAILWYRDILMAKRFHHGNYLIQKDKEQQILKQAKKEKLSEIFRKLEIVAEAKRQLAANANFQLTMELMLIKLKESSI